MNNLVVFGCSHTTGMGIDYADSIQHMDELSPNAWPYVIGKLMNLNVINNATPGSGCKEISYKILNYTFNKNDIVMILWPNLSRNCIIDKKSIIRLNPWYDTPLSKAWFELFQKDEDDVFSDFIHIVASEKILNTKVSKVIHSFDSDKVLNKFKSQKLLDSFFSKSFYKTYSKYGLGKDNVHLNETAHKMFANDLYKFINNKDII